MNLRERNRELLAKIIVSSKSRKLRLNINQIDNSYGRADEILDQLFSVLGDEWVSDNADCCEMLICLLGTHHDRFLLTDNEIEEMSDHAIRLQSLCNQL